MAKAATSGQARAFNSMIISRLDEETLKKIDGTEFQKFIDSPEQFILNLVLWINSGSQIIAQTVICRLKKVFSSISLEATETFKPSDFFKTKSEGGIFGYVNGDLFSWFNAEVKNSPAKELAS